MTLFFSSRDKKAARSESYLNQKNWSSRSGRHSARFTVTAYLGATSNPAGGLLYFSASANVVIHCISANYTHTHAQTRRSALIKLNQNEIKNWFGCYTQDWIEKKEQKLDRANKCFCLACHMLLSYPANNKIHSGVQILKICNPTWHVLYTSSLLTVKNGS